MIEIIEFIWKECLKSVIIIDLENDLRQITNLKLKYSKSF